MEIVTTGLFKLKVDKNYVVMTSDKQEVGTLDMDKDEVLTVSFINPEEAPIVFEDEIELTNWLDSNDYIISAESPRWEVFNPNPTTDKANDCSIRAYCAAENLEWNKAYDIAAKYGKMNNYMPNDGITCNKILTEEFAYEFVKLSKDEKGITVNEFAIKHPKGIFVCNCRKHLVTVIDGRYYDSWDSGDQKISKGYYVK